MSDGNTPMLGSSVLDKYNNLPSNSKKTKAEAELEQRTSEEIAKIKKSSNEASTDGNTGVKTVTNSIRKKKPLGTRFKETFLSEESDSVGSYIFWDILVPSAKETVSDLVTGAINILLFGDASSGPSRKRNGSRRSIRGGFTDYTSSTISRKSEDDRKYGRRSKRCIDDFILPDRQTAQRVLEDMKDLIADYGQCSVADYYDFINQNWEATDKYWGWTDLSGVRPRAVRGGCILDLPDLEQL